MFSKFFYKRKLSILIFFILTIQRFTNSLIVDGKSCKIDKINKNNYAPYFKNSINCDKKQKHLLVPFGDRVVFNCSYDSKPESLVMWFKSNNDEDETKVELNYTKSELIINKANLNDEAFYSCLIENNHGRIYETFFLQVSDIPLVHPIFKHEEEIVYGNLGSKVYLDCSYKSDDITKLYFFKANHSNKFTYNELIKLNDKEKRAENILSFIKLESSFNNLTENSQKYKLEKSSIIIDKLEKNDFGIFMCIAENKYGKAIKFVNLIYKKENHYYYLIFFVLIPVLFLLIFLVIFQTYLRKKIKKKLINEKKKSYIIKKKVVIDYFIPNSDQIDNFENLELNSYKNCPAVIPIIDIIKERKELKDTSNEINKLDLFEIDTDPEFEIDRNCLKLDESIGSGHFGVVLKGLLYNNPLNSFENKNHTYVNEVVSKNDKNSNKSIIYTNTPQINYNYIIDHFNNNNLMNMTAFSNNYYGLQDNYGQFAEFSYQNNCPSEKKNIKNCIQEARIVAVKKLKDDYNEEELKNFISEMVMMKLYGNHANIINLIGTCTKDGPFFVIMEYAEKGNLKDFLKNYRINNCYLQNNKLNEKLTSKDLINFALQIALGMQHLAICHCIHRDLAARNVLVTSNLIMKIADFGLSRKTGYSEYYRKSSNSFVPIKWLAPECISCSLYTTQTDVWSYGVLLWEITSLGRSPYENLDPKDLYSFLKSGKRMEKPYWCNNDMYQLMLDCWSWDPKKRPSFDEIVLRLKDLYQKEVQLNYLIYNVPTPESSEDEC